MQIPIRLQTTVLEGHRIEITAPQLSDGDIVEVIVWAGSSTGRRPMLDVLKSLPSGPMLFPTPEDADRYLREERDSWEH